MTPNLPPKPPRRNCWAGFRPGSGSWAASGHAVTLTHNGENYLATCDDRSFAVYRVLEQGHFSPGRPGWPVCLVTNEAVVDETSPPQLPEDEFASGLSLNGWLDLIESLDATP